jgi:Mn2+/Fe2+ NRAMP family transporter
MKIKFFSWKTILLFLAVVGPGIITANVDNDASGIATYSLAGAKFGYVMLWTVIPITLLMILVQDMTARIGIVSGKGLADLIRENFGVKLTFLIMIGLYIANLMTTIAEFAGIAVVGKILGIPAFAFIPVCAFLAWMLIKRLKYTTLEKVFLILIVFYLAYIISGFLAKPDWNAVGASVVIPEIKFEPVYFAFLVALIGTSLSPWMQFYLQGAIVEKGLKIEHLNFARLDVIMGSIMTGIVMFFVIVATASTIHGRIDVNNLEEVAVALQPLAGTYASGLFALGLFFAAFLGACILPISTAYFICEGLGLESGINKSLDEAPQFYGIMAFSLIIGAVILLIPNISLIPIFIISQVINGVLLPVVIVLMLLLINNKKIMKEYANSFIMNLFAIIGVIVLTAISAILVITTLLPQKL